MRTLALAALMVSGTALAQQQVWNPGTGYFNFDGGNNAPGPLYPYMTPAGALTGSSYPYASNVDIRTSYNGPVYSVTQVGDFDSLVSSYPGDRTWNINCSSNLPAYQLGVAAPQIGSPLMSAVDLNPEALTASPQIISSRFSLPAGATSATITAYMQKGTFDTGTTGLGFINSGCNTNLGTTTVTLNSTMTPYSFTKTGLSTRNNYYSGIFLNNASLGASATSDPVVGSIQVKPVGGTGVFAGDFWRVGASAKTLWGNSRDYFYADGTFHASPASYMVFETDAATMAVEIENTTAASLGLSIAIFVNGLPFTTYQPTQNGSPEYTTTITLPTGDKEIEVFGSVQSTGGLGPDSHEGTYLDAVYFPASATTRVRMPPAPRSLVFYGDSICQGNSFPVPVEGGYPHIIRRWFNGSVYLECEGSRALAGDLNNGSGAVNQTNLSLLVQYMSWFHPTDIWLAMGINDYQGAGSGGFFANPTQFAAAYAALLDGLHQRNPGANIYMQSLLITGLEATAVNGFTPPNYRTQQQAICAARSTWCTFVDGTTLLASADIGGDNIHPLAGSHSKLARSVLTKLNAVPVSGITSVGWSTQWTTCTLAAGTCTVTDNSVAATSLITATDIGGSATGPCNVVITAGTSYAITCAGGGTDKVAIARSN